MWNTVIDNEENRDVVLAVMEGWYIQEKTWREKQAEKLCYSWEVFGDSFLHYK